MENLIPYGSDSSDENPEPKSFPPDDRSKGPRRDKSRRRKPGSVLDENECLAALSELLGLIALKMVLPAQANAMRSVLATILQHYQRSDAARSTSPLSDDNVMAMLRTNPELISMLEPFLTDAQLAMVMKEATDGDDEQT